MKIKNLMFLGAIFILLFSLSFSVLAQYEDRTQAAWNFTYNIMDYFSKAITWVFGGVGSQTIVYLAVFIILAIMFSDALLTFSPLSRRASIAVGILLALITAVIRGVREIVEFLFGWTAVLGAAGMLISLLLCFAAYMVFHFFLFGWIFKGLLHMGEKIRRQERTRTIKAGGEFLEDVGKWVGGRIKK